MLLLVYAAMLGAELEMLGESKITMHGAEMSFGCQSTAQAAVVAVGPSALTNFEGTVHAALRNVKPHCVDLHAKEPCATHTSVVPRNPYFYCAFENAATGNSSTTLGPFHANATLVEPFGVWEVAVRCPLPSMSGDLYSAIDAATGTVLLRLRISHFAPPGDTDSTAIPFVGPEGHDVISVAIPPPSSPPQPPSPPPVPPPASPPAPATCQGHASGGVQHISGDGSVPAFEVLCEVHEGINHIKLTTSKSSDFNLWIAAECSNCAEGWATGTCDSCDGSQKCGCDDVSLASTTTATCDYHQDDQGRLDLKSVITSPTVNDANEADFAVTYYSNGIALTSAQMEAIRASATGLAEATELLAFSCDEDGHSQQHEVFALDAQGNEELLTMGISGGDSWDKNQYFSAGSKDPAGTQGGAGTLPMKYLLPAAFRLKHCMSAASCGGGMFGGWKETYILVK